MFIGENRQAVMRPGLAVPMKDRRTPASTLRPVGVAADPDIGPAENDGRHTSAVLRHRHRMPAQSIPAICHVFAVSAIIPGYPDVGRSRFADRFCKECRVGEVLDAPQSAVPMHREAEISSGAGIANRPYVMGAGS